MAENRREFIQRGLLSISAIPTISSTSLKQPPNLKAQDVVSLGKSGIDVSRLGFGLGVTFGKIYREMGQTAFSRLIHCAYDLGIRYFDLAGDIYVGMHLMLGEALKGVRRDSYYLITQTGRQIEETIPELLTRYQKELRTDYFDAVLRTSVRKQDWASENAKIRDRLSEAKERGVIRSHGVSSHALPALRTLAEDDWVELGLLRVNYKGYNMDGPTGKYLEPSSLATVLPHIKAIHNAQKGVIAMKVFGGDGFTAPEERRKSVQFVLKSGCVDSLVVGFRSEKEIKEVISMIET
jgi:aryl-alcohol dehydrogenase-like predicted oxidoreductase